MLRFPGYVKVYVHYSVVYYVCSSIMSKKAQNNKKYFIAKQCYPSPEPVGKMVLIDLLNTELPQTFNLYIKNPHNICEEQDMPVLLMKNNTSSGKPVVPAAPCDTSSGPGILGCRPGW